MGAVDDGRGPRVRLWVEDQGPGIPSADRDRVWEPYVRLDRDVVEGATGGSGIGLAVVRELVALHGGRTSLEGAAGRGTREGLELAALQSGGGPTASARPPDVVPAAAQG